MYNKIYGWKRIPVLLHLWCHHSVLNHGWLSHTWNKQTNNNHYSCYFNYPLFLLFKGSCKTLEIVILHLEQILVAVSTYKQLSSCWSLELYYVPHLLIDRAPWNDATSFTMYTTLTSVWHKHIHCISKYMYIKPCGSNYSDDSEDHKNSWSGIPLLLTSQEF